MPHTNAFRDLKVWHRSMDLVERIYEVTAAFPKDERFGLTAQIRRAAVSVPSNIGEGSRRKKRKAFLNHLDIALGSQGGSGGAAGNRAAAAILENCRLPAHADRRRGDRPDAERSHRLAST